MQPRTNNTAPKQNPTFIEEEDRDSGTDYENGTGDGFTPRNANPADEDMTTPPDPLDQTFGTQSANGRETLRFKIPSEVINQRNPAPTHKATPRVNKNQNPEYPLLKLDEKITSRAVPQRTRLISRRSWQQPLLAKNIARQTPAGNNNWVPVPSPTQLVQK